MNDIIPLVKQHRWHLQRLLYSTVTILKSLTHIPAAQLCALTATISAAVKVASKALLGRTTGRRKVNGAAAT